MNSAARSRRPAPSEIIATALVLLLALFGVAMVMAPGLTADLPGRDAGVFLYIGDQILEGRIPYRDVWDHKGPLIYYINAVGVSLTPGSEAGVWLLEAIALFASGLGLYWLLKRVFGKLAAALAVAIFYAGLGYTLSPGNYTEEFALPMQVAALWLFAESGNSRSNRRRWFLIGMTGAAAFLLRPNNAGIQFSIAVYLLIEGAARGRGMSKLGWFGLGVGAVLAPVGAFFVATGATMDMVDAVLGFNAVYIQFTLLARMEAVLEGLRLLAPTGLSLLAFAAWISAGLSLRAKGDGTARTRLVRLAVIAFPVELLIIGLAGRSLNHYYMAWLPISAVLVAHLLARFLDTAEDSGCTGNAQLTPRVSLAIGMAIAALLLPARQLVPPFIEFVRSGPRQPAAQASELAEFESEYLLMWGAETAYNFLSGMPSPTRFAYQSPLYRCGYVTDEMADEFRRDVMQRLPLIVDSSTTNPAVPPIDAGRRAEWSEATENCALTAPMLQLLDFIRDNYEVVGRTSYAGWRIYRPAN